MKKTAITPTRADDFNEWYQQAVYASDLAEHSPVRGCMVIKPWGYALWERMQHLLDASFKSRDVQNIYCPLLIPVSFLAQEAAHVTGFAKECAVVTHHRLALDEEGRMVPASPLAEPYVIRPTSEAMMGHLCAQWVQSYRDLPLKLNQWANVMRWEMRPRLFLRTSEFLWQEGHTVHATEEEARAMTTEMIQAYQSFFEDYLAIPVLAGRKTERERFSGAEETWCIEAIMQDAKALQAGTSHFLGQHFSKAFDIQFLDQEGQRRLAWTTSWGVTTRMIGALVMSHGDDDGLLLPPRLSPHQVVLIPVIHQKTDVEALMAYIDGVCGRLASSAPWGETLRCHVDRRPLAAVDKKWSWVKKGVPIRLEMGGRECAQQTVTLTRRDTGGSEQVALTDLAVRIEELLYEIHAALWTRALTRIQGQIRVVSDPGVWREQLMHAPEAAYMVPWAGSSEDEEALHAQQWTIRCLCRYDHPWLQASPEARCVVSGQKTELWALVAKAY